MPFPQFNEFDVTEADVHDKKNVVSVAKIRRRVEETKAKIEPLTRFIKEVLGGQGWG